MGGLRLCVSAQGFCLCSAEDTLGNTKIYFVDLLEPWKFYHVLSVAYETDWFKLKV